MLNLFSTDPSLGFMVLLGLVISLVLHEMAHAYVAYWSGDPTPKIQGKLTFNPVQHIDPFGMLLVVLIGFGYAKPVYTQPEYYKYAWSNFAVSAAGVVVNMIIAVFCLWLSQFVQNETLGTFLIVMTTLNVGLAVFNSLPIPPLDGSNMLIALLPKHMQTHWRNSAQGLNSILFLVIALVANNVLGDPLGQFIRSVVRFLAQAILG